MRWNTQTYVEIHLAAGLKHVRLFAAMRPYPKECEGSVSRRTELAPPSELPTRKHPAHPSWSEVQNRSIIIFLTVCTKTRARVLANARMHSALVIAWQNASHWRVGKYVVMPDHVHLFCSPATWPPTRLANWVRHWKAAVCQAVWARAGTLWQRDYWDTQLRRHDHYGRKWEYARLNPVRAGLVISPEQWPYHGEIAELRWHD